MAVRCADQIASKRRRLVSVCRALIIEKDRLLEAFPDEHRRDANQGPIAEAFRNLHTAIAELEIANGMSDEGLAALAAKSDTPS